MIRAAVLAVALLLCGCKHEAKLPGSVVKVNLTQGHGSGVHIGGGYILTAAHVAGDQNQVGIETDDGNKGTAEVIWGAKAYDVALLHTDTKLEASALSCRAYPIGTRVRAIGNPGDIDFYSTWGRIGGGRKPDENWKSVISVDLTLLPGMSGGGLFDKDKMLIGILVGVMVMGAPVPIGYVVPSTAFCGMLGRI